MTWCSTWRCRSSRYTSWRSYVYGYCSVLYQLSEASLLIGSLRVHLSRFYSYVYYLVCSLVTNGTRSFESYDMTVWFQPERVKGKIRLLWKCPDPFLESEASQKSEAWKSEGLNPTPAETPTPFPGIRDFAEIAKGIGTPRTRFLEARLG